MQSTKEQEQEDQELFDLKVSLELPIDCVTKYGAPNTFEKVYYGRHDVVALHYYEYWILRKLNIDENTNARALKLNIFHVAAFIDCTEDQRSTLYDIWMKLIYLREDRP